MFNGLVEFSLVVKGQAKVGVHLVFVGPEPDCLCPVGFGLGEVVLAGSYFGEEDVEVAKIGPLLEELLTDRFGLVVVFLKIKVEDFLESDVELYEGFGVFSGLVELKSFGDASDVAEGFESFKGVTVKL